MTCTQAPLNTSNADTHFVLACAVLWAATLGSCADAPAPERVRDTAALEAALADAQPGDRLSLDPAGAFSGSFQVPPGVIIDGNGALLDGGAEISTEVGNPPGDDDDDDDRAYRPCVLCVETSAGAPTRIHDVRIANDGIGILAIGDGRLELEDVDVRVERGAGVAAQVAELDAARVVVQGPITDAASWAAVGASINPRRTAVVAVLVSGGEARLEDVAMRDTAGFGLLMVGVQAEVYDTTVSGVVGTSVLIEGGASVLERMQVVEGRAATQAGPLDVATGVAITQGAQVTSRQLEVRAMDGIGCLQDDARAHHTDLVLEDIDRVGVWVQRSVSGAPDQPSLRIEGASRIDGANGSGVVWRDAEGLDLDGLTVANTQLSPAEVGPLNTAFSGDGVQISGGSGQVRLSGLRLLDNARVGFLLDGQGQGATAPIALDLSDITIDADADAPDTLGVFAQNGADLPPALQAQIARPEALRAKDDAAAGGPPRATFPSLDNVTSTNGLIDLSGDLIQDGGFAEGVRVQNTSWALQP